MDRSPKILIVEDQFFIAADSEVNLVSAGFDCVGLATTADQALLLARECRPDIVLMDIRLACSSDGLKAAREIYRVCGIRSIFASGHADRWLREEAEDAHPLGWLDKPYTGTQLIREIERGLAELESGEPDEPKRLHS